MEWHCPKLYTRIMVMKTYSIMLPICTYTAGIILMSIQNDDKLYFLYTVIIVFISAICMAINIWKSEPQKRFKNSILELGYCLFLYSLMKLLTPVLGNIISSFLIIITCVIYINKINPIFMGRNLLKTNKK